MCSDNIHSAIYKLCLGRNIWSSGVTQLQKKLPHPKHENKHESITGKIKMQMILLTIHYINTREINTHLPLGDDPNELLLIIRECHNRRSCPRSFSILNNMRTLPIHHRHTWICGAQINAYDIRGSGRLRGGERARSQIWWSCPFRHRDSWEEGWYDKRDRVRIYGYIGTRKSGESLCECDGGEGCEFIGRSRQLNTNKKRRDKTANTR